MKKLALFLFLLVVGLFLLGGVIKNIGIGHILLVFASFPWWGILILLALTAVGTAAGIVRWQRILRWQNIDADIWFLAHVWLSGLVPMYIAPVPRVGGDPLRAEFLRKKYNLSLAQAMKSIIIDEISEATVWMFFIAGGILLFFEKIGVPQLNKSLVYAGIAFFFLLFVLVFVYVLSFKRKQVMSGIVRRLHLENSKGGRFLKEFESDMINFFHPGNPVLWETLFLSFLRHAFDLARIVFVIFALGKGTHWGFGLISYMMFSAGYAFPVPGALGVQEAGQALTFGLLAMGPETGVVLSLLIRGADVAFVAVGLLLLLHRGLESLGIHKILGFLSIEE